MNAYGALLEWRCKETWITRRKTWPRAISFATCPKRNDLGSNPGLCGKRPTSNNLSHSTISLRPPRKFAFLFEMLQINAVTQWGLSYCTFVFIYLKYFECVEEFKYFVTILINKNGIHEEIASRLKSGNIFYLSLHIRLSASLLS